MATGEPCLLSAVVRRATKNIKPSIDTFVVHQDIMRIM